MRTDQQPHALRVAGRYAKDTLNRLGAWFKGPTEAEQDAWLREHHSWVLPYIEEELPQIIAELRAHYGKEPGRE